MSFLFSFFVLPFVLIGMLLSCKDLYLFLKKRMGPDSAAKAGKIAFVFAVVSAGLIAAPHFLIGAIGAFSYVLAAVYCVYLVVGAVHVWQWLNLIRRVEDGDPSNDPKFHDEGKSGDCGCPSKKGDAGKPTPPASK